MSADTFEFDDRNHAERFVGTLHDPAATPGDVLTVQADGSVAAKPGGGSMPGAARWIGPHTAFGNLLQTVDMNGDIPDAGTFTLTYDGNETDPIAWDADAAALQAAIAALPGLDGSMQVTCYVNDNFGAPDTFPDAIMAVVITNTPDRPLALAVGANNLTAGGNPVGDPVVGFDAFATAWYCIAEVSAGDIVDDIFVALIEQFLSGDGGAYDEDGRFLFPGEDYINLTSSAVTPTSDHFTRTQSVMSAQMIDAGSYGVIPTLALDDSDLFWGVINRGGDDSAGHYKLYVRLATPSVS